MVIIFALVMVMVMVITIVIVIVMRCHKRRRPAVGRRCVFIQQPAPQQLFFIKHDEHHFIIIIIITMIIMIIMNIITILIMIIIITTCVAAGYSIQCLFITLLALSLCPSPRLPLHIKNVHGFIRIPVIKCSKNVLHPTNKNTR